MMSFFVFFSISFVLVLMSCRSITRSSSLQCSNAKRRHTMQHHHRHPTFNDARSITLKVMIDVLHTCIVCFEVK
jgi:hypothetical protein